MQAKTPDRRRLYCKFAILPWWAIDATINVKTIEYRIQSEGVKHMSKNVAITMRLHEEDAEKFKTLAQQNGISQADFLVQLMNRYGIQEQAQERYVSGGNTITVYLYKHAWLLLYPTIKMEKARKYEFPGQRLYCPPSLFTRPATEVADLLKQDFDFILPLDNSQFSHVANLFYDERAKKYLVNEIMVLNQLNNGLMQEHFSISRCLHVKDFGEFCSKFHKYAMPANLTNVQLAMADDVGEDYSIFEKFFN